MPFSVRELSRECTFQCASPVVFPTRSWGNWWYKEQQIPRSSFAAFRGCGRLGITKGLWVLAGDPHGSRNDNPRAFDGSGYADADCGVEGCGRGYGVADLGGGL